jgi:EmrB/QacA subfamily drug resistance transporter
MDGAAESVYPLGSKRKTLVVFSGVILGMLIASLNQTIVSTALPVIVGDLGGLDQYSWVVTAYLLGSTVTVPLYGKLSDIYGRRPLFMTGILVFSAGSVVCAVAPTMEILIAGRAVQGLGAGGLIPLAIAVIGDIIPPRKRGKWQGLTGSVFAASSIAGPALGGAIADHASWRLAFVVSLPIAAIALTVVWFTMAGLGGHAQRSVDYVGAALLTVGASAGLLAASWGGVEFAWSSPIILGLLVATAVALVLFARSQTRATEPILPLELFRNRTFLAGALATFAIGGAMFTLIIYVPLFVQNALGESATSSGAIITPLMLSWILASVGSGQIVSRWGSYRPILRAGPPLMALGFYLMTRVDLDTSPAEVTRNIAIIGFGIGLQMQNFTVVVQNAVAHRQMGIATAGIQFSRSIGATITVALMGAIVTSRLGVGAAEAANVAPAAIADAIHPVFGSALVLVALTFVAGWLVPYIPLRHTFEDRPAHSAPAPTTRPA